MDQITDFVTDLAGNAVPGALVRVLNASQASAAIYDAQGRSIPNPITTDARGGFSFAAPNGKYYLQYTVNNRVIATDGPRLLYDPADDTGLTGVVSTLPGVVARIGSLEGLVVSITDPRFSGGASGRAEDDASAARDAAIDYLIERGGGTLVFPGPATYRLTKSKTINSGNIALVGQGGAKIFADFPDSSTSWLFRFSPAVATVADVAITANIARGAAAIQVADGTKFTPGQYLTISSGEYFDGITGVSGYQVETKGEINRVLFVAGNTVYLAIPAQDSYDNAAYPVTVTIRNEVRNVRVTGLHFYGTGNGNSHSTANPTGVRGLWFQQASGIQVDGCKFENFPRFGAYSTLCENLRVYGNEFIGRDLAQVNNAAIIASLWFTGFCCTGCQNVDFTGNLGAYLRRHLDVDAGESAISRNITINGNTAIACRNVVGTHGCDGVTMTGNVGRGCNSGIAFRGKNLTAVGNDLGNVPDYLVKLGGLSGPVQTYAESPNVGHIVIGSNRGRGGTQGLYLNVNCDSLNVTGNDFTDLTDVGVYITGRRVANINLAHNILSGVGSGAVGIHILNKATDGLLAATNIAISHNRVSKFFRGVGVDGASRSSPLENLNIESNVFDQISDADIRIGNAGTDSVLGWFGFRIRIWDNTLAGAGLSINYSRCAQMPDEQNSAPASRTLPVYSSPGAAAPSAGSIVKGQFIKNSAPASGAYAIRSCTESGTFGALPGNTTGAITAGSTTLVTTNAAGNIHPGAFLTIAGAGAAGAPLKARVLATPTTSQMVLDAPATTTVSAGAVAFTAPVLKGAGLIET